MTLVTLLIAFAGILATAGGGYLLGVILGRQARRALAARGAQQAERIEQLQLALSQQDGSRATAERVRQDMRSLIAPLLGEQQANAQQLQHQLQQQLQQLANRVTSGEQSGQQMESLREELHRTLAPMLERDREQKGLRELMLGVLGPLMEQERRAQGLKTLSAAKRGRGQLPALLDKMARRGGFAAVLLSDDVGLPLAASSGARNADVLAGVSSLILTLADRVAKTGGPIPTAVLVRDASNQLILHRIFSAGDERFLVTAVSKAGEVSTTALDPALAALEDVLARGEAA